MKKTAALILSMLMVLSCLFAVSADTNQQTFGLDNFLDTSKDLTVAFLGGSITEGSGSSPSSNRYATLVTNEFFQKTRTDGAKVTEINGGVGGTGAAFGLQRINKDITYANPDIVFVEFAVNDASTAEASIKNSMENIVRQLQRLPKIPEIIFLYTTCLAHDNVTRAASYMSQVAKAYNIPEIDLNTYIWDGVEKGEFVWNKDDKDNTLTGDNTHPNNKGYRVYADKMIEVMSQDGFFKKNIVLENPLFYTSATEHPVCVDTNAGNGYTSEDRIVRADYKTAAEAGLSSGYTLADAAAKLTKDNMLITDGSWENTSTVSDGTYSSNVGKHMDLLSVSNTAGDKMYYRFTGTAFGIFGANGPKGGNLITNIYKASDLTTVFKSASIGRYQAITYYKPSGNYSFSGLPFDTYIVEMTTAAGSTGGTVYGIGYLMIDDAMPTVKPQALNAELQGDAYIGSKLTAAFTYKGNSISAGTHKYEWLSSDSLNGTLSLIGTEKDYTVTENDGDKYITCKITPVNSCGVEGTAVYTSFVKIAALSMAKISLQGDFEGETTLFQGISKSSGDGMNGTAAAETAGSVKTSALPVRSGNTYYYSVFVKPENDITASIKVNRNSASAASEEVTAKAGVWTRISFADKIEADDLQATAELILSGKALIDDFMCIEVKSSDKKSNVMPMICNLEASRDTEALQIGTTVTVNAGCYDVNLDADAPSLSYKWQISDDGGLNWTDISDGASYKLTEDVSGKYLRAVAAAKATDSDGFEKTDEEYYLIRFSSYGDIMYFNDANTESAAKSFTTRFTNISSVSYDAAAGINGSGAAVVTRTKPTTGSTSNDRSDRINQFNYNFKAGYTYFMSMWAKKTRADIDTAIGFYLIPANSKSYVFTGKKGTGTSFTSDLGNGKWINTGMGNFSTDWTRYSLGYKIENISLDGESCTDSNSTTSFTVTMSGKGGVSGDYAENAPISESNPAKFLFDDYFIIEVPSDNLLCDVLPRVSKAEISGENRGVGSTFTAEGESYDVNPYANPQLSYTWQTSEDGISWSDSAQHEKTYTAKSSDAGKYIRAIITAASTDSFGILKSHSVETSSEFIEAPEKDGSVTASGAALEINGRSASEFAPGNAKISFVLTNNFIEEVNVTSVFAVYTNENGVKKLSGLKKVSKAIAPGLSADVSMELTIPENAEAKLITYFTDDLIPISVPGFKVKENVVFVGTDDENDVTIYEINKFNPID